jgi:hypothetical protein
MLSGSAQIRHLFRNLEDLLAWCRGRGRLPTGRLGRHLLQYFVDRFIAPAAD